MKIYKHLILLFFLWLVVNSAFSQIITAAPEFPTADSAVTITFDATEGNQGLMDFSEDVYAHTGVITENSSGSSDWKYVATEWGEANDAYKLEQVNTNLYTFEITPSIREYYGVPDGEKIEQMAFVFRNGDGTEEAKTADGGDIFYKVFQSGLQASISNPSQSRFIAASGEYFTVDASASSADSMKLYAGDQLLHTSTSKSLSTTVSLNTEGGKWLWTRAYYNDERATDSLYIYIRGDVNEAELPQGAHNGVNYVNDTAVTLVLHAPGKEFAYAIGGFSGWLLKEDYYMNKTPDGSHFWVTLNNVEAGREYVYQYLVDDSITIADPYTEKVLDPWNDKYIDAETYPNLISYPDEKTDGLASVFQTDQESYNWEVTNFTAPAREDLVVYELLVRDFTEDGEVGNINGVMDKLDYLDSLGVNAIELMPVNEFEGNDSWGYNPSFYFAFDKAYGRKQDLKAFVDSCHKRGMAVIVDMVLNHSYGQSPFVQLYFDENAGEYGQPTAANPWYNEEHNFANEAAHWGFDFNHESPHTKALIDSINNYWMQEYNVDGFRFDFTKGFSNTQWGSNSWGSEYDTARISNLKRMTDEIWKTNEDAYVILEHLAVNAEEKELANYGMMLWGNMNYNYNEATMGYHSEGKSDLSGISYKNRNWNDPRLVGYMESHDEERLMFKNLEYGNSSGDYDVTQLSTALDRIELAANFFIPVPGPKMIWQFGELGYDISIDENGRVGKKPVKWEYYEQQDRKDIYQVYATLNTLKREEPAFSSSDFNFRNSDGEVKELVIRHDDMDVYVIGNFGVTQNALKPGFTQEGKWYELYSSDSIKTSEVSEITLEPGEYRFYTTKFLDKNEFPVSISPESYMDSNESIKGFPNPVTNTFYLRLTEANPQTVLVRFVDKQGRSVKTSRKQLNAGSNMLSFNLNSFQAGIYFYNVHGENISKSGKVIVK